MNTISYYEEDYSRNKRNLLKNSIVVSVIVSVVFLPYIYSVYSYCTQWLVDYKYYCFGFVVILFSVCFYLIGVIYQNKQKEKKKQIEREIEERKASFRALMEEKKRVLESKYGKQNTHISYENIDLRVFDESRVLLINNKVCYYDMIIDCNIDKTVIEGKESVEYAAGFLRDGNYVVTKDPNTYIYSLNIQLVNFSCPLLRYEFNNMENAKRIESIIKIVMNNRYLEDLSSFEYKMKKKVNYLQ